MRVLLQRGHHIEVLGFDFEFLVLGLWTLNDYAAESIYDSRFTIYGLNGEMGETILANSDEAPPDILLTAVKAFK
jgi:hypothetical protein